MPENISARTTKAQPAGAIKEDWHELIAQAKLAGSTGDTVKAEMVFQKAYDLSRDFDQTDGRRGESAYYLGTARIVLRQPAKSLYEEALKFLWPTADNAEKISKVCLMLGSFDFKDGRLDQAEVRFRDAYKLQEQHGLDSTDSATSLKLVLLKQEKWTEALPLLEKALEREIRRGTKEGIISALRDLAAISNSAGDTAREMKYQKELLRLRGLKTTAPRKTTPIPRANFHPAGWGYDTLTHFIDAAQQNEIANFARYPELVNALTVLNDRFLSTRENLTIPMARLLAQRDEAQPFIKHVVDDKEWLEPFFFMQCHTTFMSAVRSALASSIIQTKRDLRGCLENAMYAFFVRGDNARKQTWLDGANDDKANKDARNLFKAGSMLAELKKAEPVLGELVSDLYVATIDEGAHPSAQAYFQSAFQGNTDGVINLGVAYLNPDEAEATLQQTKKVGEAVLRVFELIFPHLVE